MAQKYYRYTLDRAVAAEDAARALGEAAADGVIVRVDSKGGQTSVIVARSGDAKPAKLARGASGGEEVSEKDVLNVGR